MIRTFKIRDVPTLVHNGGSSSNRRARRLCVYAIQKALEAIDPSNCLTACIKVDHDRIIVRNLSVSISDFSHVNIIAVGKASVPMMDTTLGLIDEDNVSGILVAPKGEKIPRFDSRIEIFQAGHPLPDEEGFRAARRVMAMLDTMRSNDLLLCLISGGASALLPAPVDSITLQDKRRLTEELIRTRATIHEINTVRRHISALKGGRMVERCAASSIISFIISDVAGNTLHDIASGLTAPDPTTYRDAVQVLRKYDIWGKIPRNVKRYLLRGLAGKIPETPKPTSPIFDRVHNFIIADNRYACVAAKNALQARNVPTKILTSQADMEAKSLGKLLASIGVSSKIFREPIRDTGAIIVGGETTVNVVGNGQGGRNQHTALSALIDIDGQIGLAIAAFGTDGIDGNSPAAGAIVDGNSSKRARRRGMNPQQFIARSDSFHFFKRLNDNIITGRTGTNVGDIYITVKVGE
ncbi:MAG TPA: DUF4147 domain-containing protein [Candidatus Bathyarchaeia archaeon]|nr:DUF4147 domain-containing protein [Candidatus Bathyarchaeia archaeon]